MLKGNPSFPIPEAITLAVTTDIGQVDGQIYAMLSGLPTEIEVAEAEKNGAAAVIVISSVYCK
jgi:hypothetical protein